MSFFLLYKCSNNLLTSIIYDTRNYIKSYESFVKAQEERKNNIKNCVGSIENNGSGVYVIVLGESQLRDNMSAYGYHRKTTPWLDEFKINKNTVLFDKAYSCHAYTTVSLAYALTAKNQYNDLDIKEALSILEVANIAGYETVWMSNQTRYSLADNPVTVIASSANQQIWTNTSTDTCYTVFYDGKLLERFKDIKFSKDMLIIIHLMGNHVGYDERYPKEFAVFGNKEIADKYDNSLYYNDYVMKKLVNTIVEIPNFKAMLYVSDHGEDVRHGLRHDVNRFTFDMTRIPMYMYFSDQYLNEQNEKYNFAVKNRELPFTNDLVFDTVLSLMDIKIADFYDEKNDILSEKYDSNENRFRTLYGKKSIMEDENWTK